MTLSTKWEASCVSLKELFARKKYDHVVTFCIQPGTVLYPLSFCEGWSRFSIILQVELLLWEIVSCRLEKKKKNASRSFCERNCFGQWVVGRIRVLITQMCTRTLQCTQVLLCALCNLRCQPVMLLAAWGEWDTGCTSQSLSLGVWPQLWLEGTPNL